MPNGRNTSLDWKVTDAVFDGQPTKYETCFSGARSDYRATVLIAFGYGTVDVNGAVWALGGDGTEAKVMAYRDSVDAREFGGRFSDRAYVTETCLGMFMDAFSQIDRVVAPRACAQGRGVEVSTDAYVLMDREANARVRDRRRARSGRDGPLFDSRSAKPGKGTRRRPFGRKGKGRIRSRSAKASDSLDPVLRSIAADYAAVMFDLDPYGCSDMVYDVYEDDAPEMFSEMMPYITEIYCSTLADPNFGPAYAARTVRQDVLPGIEDPDIRARLVDIVRRLDDWLSAEGGR